MHVSYNEWILQAFSTKYRHIPPIADLYTEGPRITWILEL